jgi:ribosomal protein L16 Arg81 hydroxylase
MTTAATNYVGHTSSEPKPEGIRGREATELLFPMTLETFTCEYWERRPVFIKGSTQKLKLLFPSGVSRDDYFRGVRASARTQSRNFKLGAMKRNALDQVTDSMQQPCVYIQPDEMEKMSAEGATLAVESFGDPGFAAFASAIKLQLRHLGEVRIDGFLSPAGDGFPPHLDKTSVIVVQLSGRKRWKISSAPVLPWPNGSTAFLDDGTIAHRDYEPAWWEDLETVDLDNSVEFVLEPGDVLYLPPGTIHATESMDEHSISISLLFNPFRPLDLLSRVLANRLTSDPNWRNIPAFQTRTPRADSAAGTLTVEAKEFLAARLNELRDALETLTPEDLDLNCEWHRLLADPGEATRASLSLPARTTEQLPVERTELLRLSRRATITWALGTDQDGERCMTAFYADNEISVGGQWTPFLQTLVSQDMFAAQSATEWSDDGESYPWETVQEYLQALLEQGLIERVGPECYDED